MTTVLIFGATGYIGGSVLVGLRKRYPDLAITALVRNPDHTDKIRATGASVVPGSFEDVKLVEDLSSAFDIVVNTADADNVPLATAILRGAKRRFDSGKPRTVLIHTSGVAVFLHGEPDGRLDASAKVFSDNNEADIEAITPAAIHGLVDVPILQAGVEGYVETYIVCPAAIIGPAHGPIDNGSGSLKHVVQIYAAYKRAVYVGEGSNVFQVVHIDDAVDLYLRVFELSRKQGSAAGSPYARYFVGTADAVSWKTIAAAVGGALARRGVLEDGTPHSLAPADVDPTIVKLLGASELVSAERSKSLGWNPRQVVLHDTVQADIDAVLAGMK